MGQMGFFDADKRLEALSARGDPLEAVCRQNISDDLRLSLREYLAHRV